jgi:molybdopterin-guanine dinucleotide biosynthesis protein A
MRVTARGVVLAGGRSRRLRGRDKALIDLGDGPLLHRALSRLRPLCADLLVVGDPLRHAGHGAPVIPDRVAGCGPLGGLDAALGATRAGARDVDPPGPGSAPFVLLLGCDLPFVRPRLLEALLEAPARHDVVLPTLGGRDEPLCARYATRIFPQVAEALERRQLKLIRMFDHPALDVERRAVEPGAADGATAEDLFNLNTPEDLETARRIAARRREERES